MASDAQIAEWLRRKPMKSATRLQMFNQATEAMVYEWPLEDMPSEALERATILAETAQEDCNRANAGEQRYTVKARNAEGKIVANLVLEVELDADYALHKMADSAGGYAALALRDLLQHKNKDQQQQHNATTAALKIVVETNRELMIDRQKTNLLFSTLLEKIFELKLAQITPTNEDGDDVLKEAWAVQLDKVTDGAITHIFPRLGNLLDEQTKKLLADTKPKKGRPPKTKNGARAK